MPRQPKFADRRAEKTMLTYEAIASRKTGRLAVVIAILLAGEMLPNQLLAQPAAATQRTEQLTILLEDWQSRDAMSGEDAQGLRPACCGEFIEPPGLDSAVEPDQADTEIDTESPVRQPEPGQFYVDGSVNVQQGYRSVQASDGAHLNQDTNILTLQGDVIFREPGFLITGNGAELDQNSGNNLVDQAAYVTYETQIHGTASNLAYNSETGMLTMDNGEFSRCEPYDPFWVVRARRLQLDNANGVGYASALTLRIKDVPVFYYPYTLQFPISDQRVSGILPPSLSNSRDNGLDIAVPYYFNLAPHYDATVTPRIMTERGAMVSGEFRYLADWSMNTANLALLPNDSTYDGATTDQIGDDTAPVKQRWFAGFEHEGLIGDNWRSYIDFSAVSDFDYFRDLGSQDLNVESRTHLNKEGVLAWQNTNWQAETRVQRIEILDPYVASIDINKPFDRLPELSVSGDFGGYQGLTYGVDASHVRFDRSLDRSLLSTEQINNGALVSGERNTLEPWVSLPIREPGYFIEPTARYRYADWQLDQQAIGTPGNPDRGVGVFSLDSGLIFDRPLQFNGNEATQTLEPRLYYLFSEREDQQFLPTFDTAQLNFNFNQLFRYDRFSGQDRVGDANQISAAVTTRILDNGSLERARFSIGQIFHFEDRTVSLNSPLQQWQILQPLDTDRSALVMEGSFRPSVNWQLFGDLQWDQENDNIDQGSIALRYHGDANHIVNLAYRYREKADVFLQAPPGLDPVISQTDLSAVWPVNDNWRVFGRWNYDHSNSRNLETFAGVEYSNCCAIMRLVARDWVDEYEFFAQDTRQNQGVFFQLTLLGLGDLTGGSLSNLLTNRIPGFKEYGIDD